MKPTEFKEQNVVYAKDQPEYLPLPAHRTPDGDVVSFWKLEDGDIENIQKNGGIFVFVKTFNGPLQPMSLHTETPFIQPDGSAG